ncbi:MAG: NADH-quinone oxidoreductase subunit M [Nitrososphaerota archaeon]|nr:NADH-quinone oxidoreductase subunit M [Nitrososphaerota archaeon]
MPYALLLQAVLVPIICSPLAYLLGKKFGSKASWFVFIVLAYATLALLVSAQNNPVDESYSWFPQRITGSVLLSSIGHFGLYLDGISIPFSITIYVIAASAVLFSVPYMKKKIFEQERDSSNAEETEEKETPRRKSKFGLYLALYLLYSAGMVGTVLATNLIELYFLFEFMLVPSYFLIAEFGYGLRGRVSMMYLLWTHIGALMMLLSFLAIGTQTNNFVFLGPGAVTAAQIAAGLIPWIAFGIVVGMFVKLAAFGLHVWLPSTYDQAPTPITALMSAAMTGIGGYILIRILIVLLPGEYVAIGIGLAAWGVVTMFYGGVMALAQHDLKLLLAYSSISQMGYIIFGIATATTLGVGGAVFQFVSHATAKALLFMVLGAIMIQTGGLKDIRKLGGLTKKLPITATCAMIGFLGLLGFPETNGFQSEWLIFGGGLQLGSQVGGDAIWWLLLSFLAVIATVITAAYALWAMKRVFFGQLPSHLADVKEASPYMLAPIVFLAAVTIALGVIPGLIDNPLFATLHQLSQLFPLR